jgi:hypothetical protein
LSHALLIEKRLLNGEWVPTSHKWMRDQDVIRLFGPDGSRVVTYCSTRTGEEVLNSLNFTSLADFEAAAAEMVRKGNQIHKVREWGVRLKLGEHSEQYIEAEPLREEVPVAARKIA